MKLSKKLLSILMVLGLVIVLAACNNGDSAEEAEDTSATTETTEEAAPAEEPKDVELTIVTPFDANLIGPESIDAFQMAADELGYKIKLENITDESYKTRIMVNLTGNELPDLFFTWGDSDALPYIEAGAVLPITDAINNSGLEFNKAYVTPHSDGNLYVAPYTPNDNYVVYYNKAIFAKIGKEPPKTWDEFIDVIKAVQALNDGTFALGIGEKEKWQGDLLYNTLVLREDAMAFQKAMKGEMKFTDAPFVEASKKLKQLIDMNAFQKGYLQMAPTEMNEMFFNGQIAMQAIGTWLFNPSIERLGDNLGYFPFPQSKPDGNYTDANTGMFGAIPNGMMVAKKTEFPEEAAKFAVTYSKIVNDLKVKKGQPPFIKTDAKPDKAPHPAYQQYLDDVAKMTFVQPWWFGVLDQAVGVPMRDLSQLHMSGTITTEKFVEDLQKTLKP
jgi:raffinose/stachyose/melibiose transport system substrate-binding protein